MPLIGGVAATARELSSLLPLLDRFRPGAPGEWEADPAAESALFRKLWDVAAGDAAAVLARFGWELALGPRPTLRCGATATVLTDLPALVAAIEDAIDQPGVFDYVAIVNESLGAAAAVFRGLLDAGTFLPRDRAVAALPIQPIGLAEVEWNFSATSQGQVIFPDANNFTDEHWAIWLSGSRRPRRRYRDYEMRSHAVPFHELVHCFQGHKWPLPGFSAWRAEFEASYPQALLLLLAGYDPQLAGFPLALALECCVWLEDLVRGLHGWLAADLTGGYARWAATHGAQDPIAESTDAVMDTNVPFNSYVKCALPIHAVKRAGPEFAPAAVRELAQRFVAYHFSASPSPWDSGAPAPADLALGEAFPA